MNNSTETKKNQTKNIKDLQRDNDYLCTLTIFSKAFERVLRQIYHSESQYPNLDKPGK